MQKHTKQAKQKKILADSITLGIDSVISEIFSLPKSCSFFFSHAFPLFFHVKSKNSNSSRTIWSFFVSSKQMCINSIVLLLTGFRVAWSYTPTLESAAEIMLVNGGVLLPSARGQFDLSGTNLIVRLLSRSDAGIASGCALILFYTKFLRRNSSFNLALQSILRFYCFFFS